MSPPAGSRQLETGLIVIAVAVGLALPLLGQPYVTRLATTAAILAIAATSLNFLVGYGGMVSFGHAAYLGLGAYAVAILGAHGIHSGLVAIPLAVIAAALAAVVIGALSLRASGVFFIMITLAFAQMIYYAVIAVAALGGDNGIKVEPNGFGGLLTFKNAIALYYGAAGALLCTIYLCGRLVRSRFGRVLRGIRDNERRMISLGYRTYRYKLTGFAAAGGAAGLAGALYANLDAYASPETLHWAMSGDLLVMLILGGVGTLAGPAIGAGMFLLLQEVISNYTKHWMLFFGPVLLVIVLASNRGMLGLFLPRVRQNG